MSELLDNPQEMRKLDRQGMAKLLESFDRQLVEGLELGLEADLSGLPRPSSIVICGMGGSAIGGDLIRDYLGEELRVPLTVHRGYGLPPFVETQTLVVASSYSGNTEETLSAYQRARELGCSVLCFSSGGGVVELAETHGHNRIALPAGLPPRAALAYSMVPALMALTRLGLANERHQQTIQDSIPWVQGRIQSYGLDSPLGANPAKQLALRVQGRVPVIYGSQGRTGSVASRWQSQFSENGKQLAFSGVLPEMNHNAVVGWDHPADLTGQTLPILLRDQDDHPRIRLRFEITRETMATKAGTCLEYWSEGGAGWKGCGP